MDSKADLFFITWELIQFIKQNIEDIQVIFRVQDFLLALKFKLKMDRFELCWIKDRVDESKSTKSKSKASDSELLNA